jgi:hypothetical protein
MEFGVFKLLEDVTVSRDKYEFRKINPDRYFDKDGNFIPDVQIITEENISHVGCGLNILNSEKKFLLPYKKQAELHENGSCELFLTENDVPKIKLIDTFIFNPKIIKSSTDLLHYLKRTNFPFDIETYIADNILIKTTCNKFCISRDNYCYPHDIQMKIDEAYKNKKNINFEIIINGVKEKHEIFFTEDPELLKGNIVLYM